MARAKVLKENNIVPSLTKVGTLLTAHSPSFTDPTNTEYISYRADVLAQLGMFGEAEEVLSTAVGIHKRQHAHGLWPLLRKVRRSEERSEEELNIAFSSPRLVSEC